MKVKKTFTITDVELNNALTDYLVSNNFIEKDEAVNSAVYYNSNLVEPNDDISINIKYED